jgi:HAD superfamily hydrolase (TIGR01509 family)
MAEGMSCGLAERLRLLIFDCDGVLIDSEPVVNRLVAAELTQLGWPMTAEESCARFLGLDLPAMVPLIEAGLGYRLPSSWMDTMTGRIADVLRVEAPMIPGAREALAAVSALGLGWRVASNSSHEEMEAKFGANGLLATVAGRLHSFTDVAQGKPAPDLFLAAAAAEGVPPSACLVIEDSVPGVRGAVAAGMRCLGYAPDGDATLAAAGATPLRSLFALPSILRGMLELPA